MRLLAPGGREPIDVAEDRRQFELLAAELGVPFYVCNFKKDFGRIIDYFVDEYNRGRTPNPCIQCNVWLKFGKLARYAEAVWAARRATSDSLNPWMSMWGLPELVERFRETWPDTPALDRDAIFADDSIDTVACGPG